MMGTRISDRVESGRGEVAALGWLDVTTTFEAAKVSRQRRGQAMGTPVSGYQIHHGRMTRHQRAAAWIHLDDHHGHEGEGAIDASDTRYLATSLHGVFEQDGFRAAFLADVARRAGKRFVAGGVSFAAARESQFDRLADLLEAHLDLAALGDIIGQGAPV